MSTSRPYHHGDLRDALVQAGLALLEQGGADALTLRAAARHAGVSAMAPYRHFPDKAALLAAIATAGFHLFRDALLLADANPDRRAALIAQGNAYVAFAAARPALFRLMFGARDLAPTPALQQAGNDAYAVLAKRVATLSTPHPAPVALACWALVHGLASLRIDGRLPDPPAVAPLIDLLLDGATPHLA